GRAGADRRSDRDGASLPRSGSLADDHFHAPVDGAADIVACWDLELALATADGAHDGPVEALAREQVQDFLGALLRQGVVVGIVADRVGMAGDLDLRAGALGDLGTQFL